MHSYLKGGMPLSVIIEHLGKTYQSPDGEIEALRDVNLKIQDGEFISIVGPSGCGKSTMLSIIAGLDTPSCGSVLIDGESVENARRKVGYMPQRDQLFPWRTIWGNVTLGPEIRRTMTADTKNHVRELLCRYGLSDFIGKTPSELSGGMRQRCALIRTLATDPAILLLDEPFSALDYQTRLAVSDDIHAIIKREGKTAILVTHDISESISMSDRVVVLSSRPAQICAIHSMAEMDGLSPMQRRSCDSFRKAFDLIWKELDVNA